MFSLKFVVKPEYVISYAFERKPIVVSKDLKNKLWEHDKTGYRIISGDISTALLSGIERIDLTKNMKFLLAQKESKKIIKETEKFKQKVEKDWNRNKKKVIPWIEELSGIKLPNITLNVYLTNPRQRNGRFIKECQCICWGTKDEYYGYSTQYLAHEILHLLTNKVGEKKRDAIHVLIECIDNEIIRRLTGNTKVKNHKDLDELRKKIKPYWEKYLNNKEDKDVIRLAERIKVR